MTNENLSEEELRRRIASYVQNILQRSAMALGVQVKVREKLTQLEQPAISEEGRYPVSTYKFSLFVPKHFLQY